MDREHLPPMDAAPREKEESQQEKAKEQTIARVFIFQPKSTKEIIAEIESGVPLHKIFFTKVLIAEKDNTSFNRGQLMPVGGKASPKDKTISQTAVREMFEETGTRSISGMTDIGEIDYTMRHPVKGLIKNKCHLYIADILPMDRTKVLHLAEDKMELKFLDLPKMFRLLRTGKTDRHPSAEEKQHNQLVDFLDLNRLSAASSEPGQVRFMGFDSDPEANNQVLKSFRQLFIEREQLQREKILPYLEKILNISGARQSAVSDVPKSGNGDVEQGDIDTDRDNAIGKTVKILHYRSKNDASERRYKGSLGVSVDLANFAEEMSEDKAGKNRMQAVLRFIYALSEAKFFYDDYIEIAQQNPLLSDFAERIKKFLTGVSSATAPAGGELKTGLMQKAKGLKTLLEDDGVLVEELMEHDFANAFDIPRSELADRIKLIDSVSEYILKTLQESGLEAKGLKTDPLVTQASLTKLVGFAFGLDNSKWKEEVRQEMEASGNAIEIIRARIKKMAFEARRKLALIYLVGEPHKKYQELIRLGDRYFNELVLDRVLPIIEEKKPEKRSKHSERKQSRKLYRTAIFDSELGVSEILAPPKGEESYICKTIRKEILDPANILDINRESLIFFERRGSPKKLFKRESKVLTTCDFDVNSGAVSEAKARNYEDSVAVLKFIGALSKLPGVRVMEYKPTPKEGEGIKSASPGGGAELRFAMFIVRYKGRDGIYRNKEIQIFTPNPKRRTTAVMHVLEKEADHKNYEISRITMAEQHDLVKLVYPQNIYPEVWGAYKKKK